MTKIAIVILNWNGKKLLEEFLPSVIQYSKLKNISLVIADNASADDSTEFVKQLFPSVHIIKFDKNYGFAEGYNRALSQIDSEYFIILNSDVKVTEGWLTPMLETMEADQMVAACMPKIRAYRQPYFFEYAGAAGGFIDKYGYPFCQGRIFNSIESDFGQYDTRKEVFWASGACLMIRSSLFNSVGGFDSNFYAHMEEIDLCWRLKNRGFKILMVPDSVVYHIGGGTLPIGNPYKTYLNFRNNLFALTKNLPAKRVFKVLLIRLIMDVFSELYFLFKGSPKESYAVIKAHFSYFRNRKYCNTFRKNEKKYLTTLAHREIYGKSIVFEYFIRKKYTFKSLKWILPGY